MNLNELNVNEKGIISDLLIDGLMRERLLSLGLTKDTEIVKIRSKSKNAIAVYIIRDMMIALRREEANLILVD